MCRSLPFTFLITPCGQVEIYRTSGSIYLFKASTYLYRFSSLQFISTSYEPCTSWRLFLLFKTRNKSFFYAFLLLRKNLHEIVEGLYFHCSLSVCVCLSVCPIFLVNKIPAEIMNRFGRDWILWPWVKGQGHNDVILIFSS